MKKYKLSISRIINNIILILFSLSCVLPFFLLIAISLSNETDINSFGYKLFPVKLDFTAYSYIFKNPDGLINAYEVTIFITVAATVLSLLVMSLVAYPLSRQNFRFKKSLSFYIFFTMLFSGGLVPSYILNTQYLHLSDNILVYIVPSLVSAWYIIIIRTFFKEIPAALIESAQLDGAGEFRILFTIVLPLSKPVLATVALLTALGKWNDWYNSLLYITDEKLYTLQYLLQRILMDLQLLKDNMVNMPGSAADSMIMDIPGESLRMAMAVLAAGPMIFVFPFFQKYFVRGLTVGSVKG